MARDALRVVQVVRHRQLEQTRQALAACLQSEADATDRIKAIDDAAARDRAAAQAVDNPHLFHAMFRRREQARQADLCAAEAALAAARARSSDARAEVTAARAASEAVQTLMQERAVAVAAEEARRTQHTLDDIARGRIGSGLNRFRGQSR